MPKFKVLRPIEFGGVLYLPEAMPAPAHPRSAGNGKDVKVDTTGVIDLAPKQAAEMTLGQVAATPEKSAAAPAASPAGEPPKKKA